LNGKDTKDTKDIDLGDINLNDLLGHPQDMSPSTYQYYNGIINRRIIFNDEVTDDIMESVVIPLMTMDTDGTGKPIEILINSCGGSVYAGMTLCHVIDTLKTKTTIRILAMAASMGSLIAMAGHNNSNVKVVCNPYSVFLIHAGSYYFEGSATQVKDSFEFQEKYEDIMTNYILSHSNITKEEYEKKTRYEWWLTAAEAKQHGIVDEVL
jgi:ATP-dependent Clp protease protease subunit